MTERFYRVFWKSTEPGVEGREVLYSGDDKTMRPRRERVMYTHPKNPISVLYGKWVSLRSKRPLLIAEFATPGSPRLEEIEALPTMKHRGDVPIWIRKETT